jgi:hypothetical protein
MTHLIMVFLGFLKVLIQAMFWNVVETVFSINLNYYIFV